MDVRGLDIDIKTVSRIANKYPGSAANLNSAPQNYPENGGLLGKHTYDDNKDKIAYLGCVRL
jgi:hypothetical protein